MTGLHTLKRMTTRAKRRVGRGQSSTRGKTSGRGTKGQNARAGRKKRPELRDIIKKLPKRRGYGKNRGRTVVSNRVRPTIVALARIEKEFDAGSEVTREALRARGLIGASLPKAVKIVGNTVSKKLTVAGVAVSAGARAAIEKAGGSVS